MIGKWIPGYEDEYSITEESKVYSYKHNKYLSSCDDGNGYQHVALCSNGVVTHFKIYKLVALAYLPNTENKPCINHIDGDKSNDHFTNLEWCDWSHNLQHAWDNGLRRRDRLLRGKRKSAILIDPNNQLHYVTGLQEFCIQNNLELGNLYKVFNKERNHHKGWRGYLRAE